MTETTKQVSEEVYHAIFLLSGASFSPLHGRKLLKRLTEARVLELSYSLPCYDVGGASFGEFTIWRQDKASLPYLTRSH